MSRSTYSALFGAVGDAYGAGDGSTTFNLPDFRGKVIVGASATKARGTTGGSETHALTEGEMPSHSHAKGTLATDSAGGHSHAKGTLATDSAGGHSHAKGTLATDSAGGHYHLLPRYSNLSGTERASITRADFSSDTALRDRTAAGGAHTHDISGATAAGGAHTHDISGATAAGGAHAHGISGTTATAGNGGAHNNMQPYVAALVVIKT